MNNTISINNKLKKLTEDEMIIILNKVDKNVENIREDVLNDIYYNNTAILKKKNNFLKKLKPEIRNKIKHMDIKNINYKNIEIDNQSTLKTNKKCADRLLEISNKLTDRLCKILDSPITKAILIICTSILWFLLYMHLSRDFAFQLINSTHNIISNSFNLNLHSVINNGVFISKIIAVITLSVSAGFEFIQSTSKTLKDMGLVMLKYTIWGFFFVNIDSIFDALLFLGTPIISAVKMFSGSNNIV